MSAPEMESDAICIFRCDGVQGTPPDDMVLGGSNTELQSNDDADNGRVQCLIKSEPLEDSGDSREVDVSNSKANNLLNNSGVNGFEFVAMEPIKQEVDSLGRTWAEDTDVSQAVPSQSLGTVLPNKEKTTSKQPLLKDGAGTLGNGGAEDQSTEGLLRGEVLSCSKCKRTFPSVVNLKIHESRCRNRKCAGWKDIQNGKDTSRRDSKPSANKVKIKKIRVHKKGSELKLIRKKVSKVKKLMGKTVRVKNLKIGINVSNSEGLNNTNNNMVQEIPAKVASKDKVFECDVCQKQFPRRTNLVQHTIVHTGDKRFKCGVCEKRFSQSAHLTRHSRTHTGEKPFHCITCGSRFNELSHLLVHGRKHTGEKPYECETCHKWYRHYSSLVAHKRTHTGEKPFHCEVCGKWFGHSSDLTRHSRTHTGVKPYRCNVCGACFTQSSVLTTHGRKHTGERPFQCEFCPKGFRDSSSLTTHRRIHTQEKPFACEICEKRFADSSSLTKHGRTHTGEKPFMCNMCDKQYSHCSQLIRHRKKHHKCVTTNSSDAFGEHSVPSLLVSHT